MIDESKRDESMNRSNVKTLVTKPWDLQVYQRGFKLALEVHQVSLGFPKMEQYALADQLRRSSKSICANIGEGFAKQKFSTIEFGRFLGIAEASASETQVWLQFAKELGYITETQFANWSDDCDAVAAMLVKLRGKL